jgi:CDP-glucose 4,6-dehydratase
VISAFSHPAYTFAVNVQGTVNLLECIRQSETVKSVVIITTDKVYRNSEWLYGYREIDTLGDTEPYAASKACAEMVAASYYETYLRRCGIALSTVRAGNVIGGGDVSENRIVPDCVRSAKKNEPIIVRNPSSVRPYQHVLEPLFAYLLLAQKQCEDVAISGQYNIGPVESDCITTAELVEIFFNKWGIMQDWHNSLRENPPHESKLLKLDCSKIRSVIGWKPIWSVEMAIEKTIEWEKSDNKRCSTELQIKEYLDKWKR